MKPPYLKITYDNGFEDITTLKTSVNNEIYDLVDAMKRALAGFGFSEESINEYFRSDNEPETD